ncbi:hypothetical protein P4313_30750 [Bacillus tropicus]|uniref:hypothetical protein n=1 Tax=Bacillus tropicus TaxID=2026188 RepID=UPI002E1CD3A5|nr:hypothetical protein [Bacillus tropicus]
MFLMIIDTFKNHRNERASVYIGELVTQDHFLLSIEAIDCELHENNNIITLTKRNIQK